MPHLQALLLPAIRSSAAKFAGFGAREQRTHAALLAVLLCNRISTEATVMPVSMFLENNDEIN